MAMFSMFVDTPPAGTPVNTVYSEKQAFGPFGQAAGEVSPDSGFSEVLWLEAPAEFRSLRAICSGKIRVVGVQEGFPPDTSDSPLVVELTPGYQAFAELERLCQAAKTETPQRFLYHGLSPNSLRENMGFYFDALSATSGPVKILTNEGKLLSIEDIGIGAFLDGFVSGNNSILLVEDLALGFSLGEVSDKNKNLNATRFAFGIEVRTDPPIVHSMPLSTLQENRLDPVVLFHTLSTSRLSDSTEAIAPAEVANSWLEVVTKNRVLITFRNEWNAALNSGENAIVEGPGAGQVVVMLLNDQQVGTVVAPDGWGQYTCQVSVPSSRKLSRIPSEEGASDTLTITATAPAHTVIGSIRPEDWFSPTDPPVTEGSEMLALPLYTNNNIVTPLIDGFEAFADLAKDLKALDDSSTPAGPPLPDGFLPPDHFVLLADWYIDVEFPLKPNEPDSTVRALLRKAVLSGHSVIVRALAFGLASSNEGPILALDTMDAGTQRPDLTSAFLDSLDPINGSLHWKMSVVRNRHGTFARLGGIDLNPNRLDGPKHRRDGKGYHDVHCRIQGPAVADVTEAFLQRYDQNGLGDPMTGSIRPTIDTPADVPATQMVQIARTSGKGIYSWAPQGDRTIWATLKQAIRRAKRYIYIEDQYLLAATLRNELLAALSLLPLLEIVIVIPEECDVGIPDIPHVPDPFVPQDQCDIARGLTVRVLTSHPRVQMYSISDYFVHTKVTIIDDVFATIGSANMNRRSLTNDSEINSFIMDGRIEEGARKFARDLRTRLWAEHLGMPLTKESFKSLNDIDGALELMRNRQPRDCHLIPYIPLQGFPGDDYPVGWDLIDPDGS